MCMSVKQKIVQGRGPSNINLGIFIGSFDVCRASYQSPLLTMVTNITKHSKIIWFDYVNWPP